MRRSVAWLPVAAALLVVGVACVPPPSPPATVGLIGDSIAYGLAVDGFQPQITGAGPFDGVIGRRAADSLTKVADVAARVSDGGRVVVELGTNDLSSVPVASLGDVARATVNAVPRDRCLVIVGTRVQSTPSTSQVWNTAIRAALTARGLTCDAYVDWSWRVGVSMFLGEPPMIGPDGTHLTLYGEVAMTDMIVKAVATGEDQA